jgi:medium-chain acyl-[acyl-carrier-protein] hydrolase
VEHYVGDSVGEIPSKVEIPEELPMQEVYRYQVRYSGLDNNGHLNNARYGDLCCDVLSLEEWDGRKLQHFRITYLQEAIIGQEITISRSPLSAEVTYVQGHSGDAILFTACLIFEREEK